jgi:hypothetical protein
MLLRDNRDKLDNIVAALLDHETLGELEVYAVRWHLEDRCCASITPALAGEHLRRRGTHY